MEEEDYLEIEAALAELAAAIGAPSIMDPRHYRRPIEGAGARDHEGRADRPLSARARVIEEIDALERHLALFDRATYDEAMKRIEETIVRSGADLSIPNLPQQAVIEQDQTDGLAPLVFPLSRLPDLQFARDALRDLGIALRES